MTEDQKPIDRAPFGDWRIRLGIVLGVLVFSMAVIAYGLYADNTDASSKAWDVIWIVAVAMLGFSALSDKLKK